MQLHVRTTSINHLHPTPGPDPRKWRRCTAAREQWTSKTTTTATATRGWRIRLSSLSNQNLEQLGASRRWQNCDARHKQIIDGGCFVDASVCVTVAYWHLVLKKNVSLLAATGFFFFFLWKMACRGRHCLHFLLPALKNSQQVRRVNTDTSGYKSAVTGQIFHVQSFLLGVSGARDSLWRGNLCASPCSCLLSPSRTRWFVGDEASNKKRKKGRVQKIFFFETSHVVKDELKWLGYEKLLIMFHIQLRRSGTSKTKMGWTMRVTA